MADIYTALRLKYARPEYQLFVEFTLFQGARRIDALAISPWKARGYKIIGFEIKHQRVDWLRELKNPDKAAEGSAFVDEWWLAAPKGVALPEEVPKGWGFLELRGSRLFTLIRPEHQRAVPIDRAFLARCISMLGDEVWTSKQDAQYVLRQEIRKELDEQHARDLKGVREQRHDELDRLKQVVASFREKSGVDLEGVSEWNAGKIGMAVKQILARENLPNLRYDEERLTSALEALRRARDEIDAVAARKEVGDGENV